MNQLQDMQIKSPSAYHAAVGSLHAQTSPMPTHSGGGGRQPLVGSLPAEHHLSHLHYSSRGGSNVNNTPFFSNAPNSVTTSIAVSHSGGGGGDYSTGVTSSWAPMSSGGHQSLIVNTSSAGGHQQFVPGSAPSSGYCEVRSGSTPKRRVCKRNILCFRMDFAATSKWKICRCRQVAEFLFLLLLRLLSVQL